MRIDIAARLRPFSHVSGTACIIPFSTWEVKIFATLLRFKSSIGQYIEVKFGFKGPIPDFTAELDLEKGRIVIFGKSATGYFRYFISRTEQGILLDLDKIPAAGVECHVSTSESTSRIKSKDKLVIPAMAEHPFETAPKNERLSLGSHKALDWDLVQRRQDLCEILPVWLRAGNLLPKMNREERRAGTFHLLDECALLIRTGQKNELKQALLNLFNAGFHNLLVPRFIDDQFLGLVPELTDYPVDLSPLHLLKEGAHWIRALFITEEKGSVALLPCLPTELHCGRYNGAVCADGDTLDFEWSKKQLRRVVWRAISDKELQLDLQKSIRTFRLRRSLKERGQKMRAGEPITTKAGQTLFLDRFEK